MSKCWWRQVKVRSYPLESSRIPTRVNPQAQRISVKKMEFVVPTEDAALGRAIAHSGNLGYEYSADRKNTLRSPRSDLALEVVKDIGR